jgi:hypothetical protein
MVILRQSLLHEMCHIGCPFHGRRFKGRISVAEADLAPGFHPMRQAGGIIDNLALEPKVSGVGFQ